MFVMKMKIKKMLFIDVFFAVKTLSKCVYIPCLQNFSILVELFHLCRTLYLLHSTIGTYCHLDRFFPLSRNFSMLTKLFHVSETLLHSWKFSLSFVEL